MAHHPCPCATAGLMVGDLELNLVFQGVVAHPAGRPHRRVRLRPTEWRLLAALARAHADGRPGGSRG